jgi:hypothetical protein
LYISAAAAQAPSADALYADRVHLENAQRAAALWAVELAHNPRSEEAAWKLARAYYWLGTHAAETERRGLLEQGVDAGQKASAIAPGRPEGHFWTAANMGALAEAYGMRQGLKYRRPIKDELETVLRIDRAFEHGSADRALGRWYFRVPRLFGGSHAESERHLKASLEYDADGTASHFFLAELYQDDGRKAEARAELQKVVDARGYPDWKAEDDEFKERARKILSSNR